MGGLPLGLMDRVFSSLPQVATKVLGLALWGL